MTSADQAASLEVANPFTAADVVAILRERSWFSPRAEPTRQMDAWCGHAATLLGGHAPDRTALGNLLALVFQYDAQEILNRVDAHEVLSRYAAREVLRQLALFLLDGEPLDSDRFKGLISRLKQELELRSRELLHPIRLALAGRAGEGELDRVILLLDEAAVLPFTVPVKSARARILEFCSSLD